MTLRSGRDRIFQTLAYEAGGLVIAVPLFTLFHDGGHGQSLALLSLLVVAVLFWAPVHNTFFDWAELRLTGRVASNRPQGLRIVHAFSYEISCMVITLPTFVFLGRMTVVDALMAEFGLTVLYVVYGYVFHLIYDKLRPVGGGPDRSAHPRQARRSSLQQGSPQHDSRGGNPGPALPDRTRVRQLIHRVHPGKAPAVTDQPESPVEATRIHTPTEAAARVGIAKTSLLRSRDSSLRHRSALSCRQLPAPTLTSWPRA